MASLLKIVGVLCLLGFPLAALGTRFGLYNFRIGLLLTAATLILSAIVVVVALSLLVFYKGANTDLLSAAKFALVLAALPVIGLGWQIYTAKSLPRIHNISTDTADPPQFDRVVALRTESDNPLDYDAERLAEQQRAAYPEVKSLVLPLPPHEVLADAVKVAQQSGWEVIATDQQAARMEATYTSKLWGFKDDVVVRVRAEGEGSIVDMRSVSRVGKSDLGANAKRITRFMHDLQQLAASH